MFWLKIRGFVAKNMAGKHPYLSLKIPSFSGFGSRLT